MSLYKPVVIFEVVSVPRVTETTNLWNDCETQSKATNLWNSIGKKNKIWFRVLVYCTNCFINSRKLLFSLIMFCISLVNPIS